MMRLQDGVTMVTGVSGVDDRRDWRVYARNETQYSGRIKFQGVLCQ